jgi:hypothetical protein
MKLAKILEIIGENTSLKEFDTLEELLTESEVEPIIINEIIAKNSNLICGQFPERDDPDKEDDEEEKEEEERQVN